MIEYSSLKKDSKGIRIVHGLVFDGTGHKAVQNAEIRLADGKIQAVGLPEELPPADSGDVVLDASGCTVLPGLVEAHFHPTYFNVAALEDLDIKYPIEYITILAAANARLALECGYTSARSGGSLHNIDVWLKKSD